MESTLACVTATDESDAGWEFTNLVNFIESGGAASAVLPDGGNSRLLLGFAFPDLPADVLVTGIKVDWLSLVEDAEAAYYQGITIAVRESTINSSIKWNPPPWIMEENVIPTAHALGSDGDLWGFPTIAASDLRAGNIWLRIVLQGNDPAATWIITPGPTMTVYYTSPPTPEQPDDKRGHRRWIRGHRGLRQKSEK